MAAIKFLLPQNVLFNVARLLFTYPLISYSRPKKAFQEVFLWLKPPICNHNPSLAENVYLESDQRPKDAVTVPKAGFSVQLDGLILSLFAAFSRRASQNFPTSTLPARSLNSPKYI
jgi:hypothetical protein